MLHLLNRALHAVMGSTSVLHRPAPGGAVRLRYGEGPYHFGELRLPKGAGPHPLVVNIHGGFWRAQYDLSHARHLCAALTKQGFATWNIEYRRIGHEGGWTSPFVDVARAMGYVRELVQAYPLDAARVVVMGHSAGGHLALWVAGRATLAPDSPLYGENPLRPRAVIALAAVSDLHRAWELRLGDGVVAELLGGSPAQQPERYAAASPIRHLPVGVPSVLIHGEQDAIVPLELSERYHTAALAVGDPCTLLPLPSAGHFEVIDPLSTAWQAVARAVQEAIGGNGG